MLQLPSILHVKNAIKVDLSLLICTTEVGDCLSNILVVAVLNAFSWSREIFIFYVVYLIFCEVYFTLLNSSSRRCSAHSVLSFLGDLRGYHVPPSNHQLHIFFVQQLFISPSRYYNFWAIESFENKFLRCYQIQVD